MRKNIGKILEKIKQGELVELELGCGNRKRYPHTIGIDILDYDCVDIVGDVFDILREFPNASVNAIYSFHFIEHISDLDLLMRELARILVDGGKVDFTVPHFSNPYFYSDPTHQSYFGLYTFCYMTNSSLFSRQVPTYQNDLVFDLERVDLKFKSTRPFYGRHVFKSIIGKVFNSCKYMKELYEENFCYIFPCYEVRYLLRLTEKINK